MIITTIILIVIIIIKNNSYSNTKVDEMVVTNKYQKRDFYTLNVFVISNAFTVMISIFVHLQFGQPFHYIF